MATKTCFDCGKVLSWTGSGPGWMNSEQWDAVKAGDYFAQCEHAAHPNGNCYFIDAPVSVGSVLKRRGHKPSEHSHD